MITKLNFVSVTGPKSDLDRMVSKYLSKFEIHLEYAPSELKSSNTLHPFTEANPYKEVLSRGEELLALTGRELTDKQTEEKTILRNVLVIYTTNMLLRKIRRGIR